MAEITASMVMKLRSKTDAPMMDCKKALLEADGEAQKAEEILRVRFGNKASKAANRIAAEGVIGSFISSDKSHGSIIEVNSETDFCAKNDEFLVFVAKLAKVIVDKNLSQIEELSDSKVDGAKVEDLRTELIGKIGENITPRRLFNINAKGALHNYIHGSKLGVILDMDGGDEQLGKDIAMHIAALKPKALDRSGINENLIDTERRVAIQKAKEAGKPEEMLEKIADGTVNKYLKEVTLINQKFVKDEKITIEQLLKQNNAKINSFEMFIVGDGIEKKEEDFAAEVAAASKV